MKNQLGLVTVGWLAIMMINQVVCNTVEEAYNELKALASKPEVLANGQVREKVFLQLSERAKINARSKCERYVSDHFDNEPYGCRLGHDSKINLDTLLSECKSMAKGTRAMIGEDGVAKACIAGFGYARYGIDKGRVRNKLTIRKSTWSIPEECLSMGDAIRLVNCVHDDFMNDFTKDYGFNQSDAEKCIKQIVPELDTEKDIGRLKSIMRTHKLGLKVKCTGAFYNGSPATLHLRTEKSQYGNTREWDMQFKS
jgi:hypothetical protein